MTSRVFPVLVVDLSTRIHTVMPIGLAHRKPLRLFGPSQVACYTLTSATGIRN